ncbi:hypothetical protein HYFRA_00000104 [Hymenoscyphus fraxineus]|uniref:Small secreted protein n=1 Tax=Hymenoscyphus fraxineus TaxID=746836 RepID=A0A9N9L378_9HELO|nr:hypothetical protein HYFRA_00000104 [Hymenoscyphus fraxineus]
MKAVFKATAFALFITAVPALDSGAKFQIDADTDVGFQGFVEEFYLSLENTSSTADFTDHFVKDTGVMAINGKESKGYAAILAAKQSFTNKNKTTNHLLRAANTLGKGDKNETFVVDFILQTTTQPGNACTETSGRGQFTLTTGATSQIEFAPHTNFLARYQVDIDDTKKTTCAPVEEAPPEDPDVVSGGQTFG